MLDYTAATQAVMRIALDGAPSEEIRAAAVRAKREISEEANALWKASQLIDSLVAFYAPSPTWQIGWLDLLTQQPQPTAAPDTTAKTAADIAKHRAAAVLTIAGVAKSDEVETEWIAERLRDAGDRTNPKNLATAIGNILNRNGYERIASGRYRRSESNIGEDATG